jgi:hypothetical protein
MAWRQRTLGKYIVAFRGEGLSEFTLTCAEEREKDRKLLEGLGAAKSGKRLHPNIRDADDVDASGESSQDDDDSDDDDDDMEALQAELEKIRYAALLSLKCTLLGDFYKSSAKIHLMKAAFRFKTT